MSYHNTDNVLIFRPGVYFVNPATSSVTKPWQETDGTGTLEY